jgi:hypothetical protein
MYIFYTFRIDEWVGFGSTFSKVEMGFAQPFQRWKRMGRVWLHLFKGGKEYKKKGVVK